MSRDTFEGYIEKASNMEVLAVDTEGFFEFDNKLLDVSECVGLSIAGQGFEVYLPFRHAVYKHDNLPGEWLSSVAKMIEDHPRLIFHNAKHDIVALKKLGITAGPFYDTMLMAHWIDENIPNKSLDYLSKMYGGMPKNRSAVMQGLIDMLGWAYVPPHLMEEYGANDARITWDLFYNLYPEFRAQGFDSELWDIEQNFTRLLSSMEQRGIRVDQDLARSELEFGEKRMQEIVNELGGLNPGSNKDLQELLLNQLKLPVVKRTKPSQRHPGGQPSFAKEQMEVYDELLERRNDSRAKLVREYRGWSITCGLNYKPYVERVSSDGRIRCNYKMHGTKTSRLSCEKPNLQQIPKNSDKRWNGKLKKAFIPDPGYRLWEGDYKQLEFRLSAAYGKQTDLIDVFNDESRDIFEEMSKEVGMTRFDTKTLNYTLAYGGGIDRISGVFGVSTAAARAIRSDYYSKYPGLAKATKLAALRCQEQGYIELWTGRRRHFENPEKEAHKAFNSAMQGGAAEIVKRAMLRCDKEGLNTNECRMLLQVHDSVVFEIQEGLEDKYLPEIKKVMEDVRPSFRGVKFAVDIHEWSE
jgi:DNA polymerase I - 3''-5'' exonuclease and polymerase domains